VKASRSTETRELTKRQKAADRTRELIAKLADCSDFDDCTDWRGCTNSEQLRHWRLASIAVQCCTILKIGKFDKDYQDWGSRILPFSGIFSTTGRGGGHLRTGACPLSADPQANMSEKE
jgi:hypothetical protein